jgi:DNA polymerase elongation subunit (family B)
MKILLLDIETAPNLAYVWGVFQQDIQVNHMVSSSTTLCWSAKWLGDKKIMFDSVHGSSHKKMLERVHALLDEADVVVHYNGRKFDIPTLNKEFLLAGMSPPAPYKQVDMLMVSRGAFRFQSNKLDYVARQLQLGSKVKHEGFQLWVSCMNGNGAAWKRMREYNQGDVLLLEKLYNRMLPWIKGHPNRSAHEGIECCPHCGSKHLQRRGTARNASGLYPRFQCGSCGTWMRGSVASIKNTGKRMVSHG